MTAPHDVPVVDFDHHSQAFWLDPEGTADALRQQHRVAWSEAHGGFWVITRAAEGSRVMRDTATFSSARNEFTGEGMHALLIPPVPNTLTVPEEMDPPEHTGIRRLFNVALSPRASAALAPRVRHWTTTFIDRVIEQGRCDLVFDITSPVPACITLELLGFSTEEWERFAEPIHNFVAYDASTPEFQAAGGPEGAGWILEQCRELIAARRAEPADDVISYWIAQEVDGAPLDDETLVLMLWQLLNGGVDTTTSLVASALVHLQRNPEDRDALLADPDALEVATEEFIRLYSPAKAHARTVMEDVELGGCPMKRGDRVLVSWISINRDEERFADSTSFRRDRFPNRHAGFGYGPHRCPGSHLARIAFRELVGQLLERMPDYEIDLEAAVRYPNFSVIGGWTSAPMTYTPGERRGSP